MARGPRRRPCQYCRTRRRRPAPDPAPAGMPVQAAQEAAAGRPAVPSCRLRTTPPPHPVHRPPTRGHQTGFCPKFAPPGLPLIDRARRRRRRRTPLRQRLEPRPGGGVPAGGFIAPGLTALRQSAALRMGANHLSRCSRQTPAAPMGRIPPIPARGLATLKRTWHIPTYVVSRLWPPARPCKVPRRAVVALLEVGVGVAV